MFKKLLNILKIKGKGQECNDSLDSSLLQMGETIKRSSFNSQSDTSHFQASLKARILEKRNQSKFMNLKTNVVSFFQRNFQIKRLAPVLAAAMLVVVVAVAINFSGDKFSPLIIDAAYAHDNFDVVASASDSIGIENNSFFIIKSKQAIDNISDLEKNITLFPQTEFKLKKISSKEFVLTPKTNLSNRQVYRLEIQSIYADANGLTSNYNYSFAFQVKDTFKIINTLPNDKSNGVPTNTGIEVTFSHENFENFEKNFSIVPQVAGRFEKHYRTAVFVPNQPLQSGTVYTVKINADVGLAGSNKKLAEEKVFQFEIEAPVVPNKPLASDIINFYDDQVEFGTDDQPVFTAYRYGDDVGQSSVNVQVQVFGMTSQDQFIETLKHRDSVPSWKSYTRLALNYDTSKFNSIAKFDDKLKYDSNTYYLQYPTKLPAGYYLVKFSVQENVSYVFVQVSDLASYVTVNTNKTLVWINSLKNGQPVKNVTVSEDSSKTKSVSGQDGVATFDSFKGNIDYIPYYLKINDGINSAVVPIYVGEHGDLSAEDKYWMYLYTDRALYQPTDNVNTWGFIKARADKNQTPKSVKLEISSGYSNWFDYYSDPVIISQQDLNVDQDGFYSGKIKLDNLTPGSYKLSVKVDNEVVKNKYFTVSTYTKPLYKISVTHTKEAVFVGEKIGFDIKTTFFDGTPVSNIGLQYNAGLLGIYAQKIQTNEKGEFHLDFDTSKIAKNILVQNFDITVSSVDSETGDISAYDSMLVFGSHAQFVSDSTKLDQIPGTTNGHIQALVKSVDLSKADDNYMGISLSNVTVTANINETTYIQHETGTYYDFINKVSRKTYTYQQVEKKLPAITFQTDFNGFGQATFDMSPEKSYSVELSITDGQGGSQTQSMFIYATKGLTLQDNLDYGYSEYTSYDLVRNNHTGDYKVGDGVNLEFVKNSKSFDGKNFLFYRNHLGLSDYKVQSNPNYSFNFSVQNIPNVYVSGVWFDGHSYHGSNSINLVYDSQESELKVVISTDKKKYKPGEEVKLAVDVKDKNGNPVRATVNVDLVDAALKDMGGAVTANPLDVLYYKISSGELFSTQTHDLPMLTSNGGAEHGGCFLAGTKIKMADGTQKNIEDIIEGDKISTFKSETDHTLVTAEVEQTFRHLVQGYLVINNQLFVTPVHRVYINNSWRSVGEAKVGDIMLGVNGNPVKIFSIEKNDTKVVVYNFKVKNYHTYIANGIYVHNDKDGVREYFPDVALFQSVQTGSNGKGEITFKLPDNVTSWYASAQAISNEIKAGVGNLNIPVSLPMFIDQSLPAELLSVDKVFGRLRAYGDGLSANSEIKFNTTIDNLDFNFAQTGKAFTANYFAIPQFSAGNYRVVSKAESGQYKDAVAHTIKVVDSRLMSGVQKFYTLKDNLKIEGNENGVSKLIFTDNGQGKMYYSLLGLSWSGGLRVDQRVSSVMAIKLFNQYFKEQLEIPVFDGKPYQGEKGGIQLLTYSAEDLELSAKVAALQPAGFDNAHLSNYFYNYLNQKEINQDEAVRALYGLAALREPVLIPIQNMAKSKDLTVINKLYLGLAAQQIGDINLARNLYNDVVKNNGEQMPPYARVKIDKNEDLSVNATVLAAILGAGLDDDSHSAFWQYAKDRGTKDILINFEELIYIKENLPHLKAAPVSFSLDFEGQHLDKKLERGESFALKLYPNQLVSLKISKVVGDVGVVSNYDQKTDNTKNTTNNIKVSRSYSVNGKPAKSFKQGDIVEVQINPVFAADALKGDYQITDLLPSGMTILTNTYSRGLGYTCGTLYPIEINGQKSKFLVGSYQSICGSYHYYARAVTPGEFKAEPAVLESINSTSQKAFSTEDKIVISQ